MIQKAEDIHFEADLANWEKTFKSELIRWSRKLRIYILKLIKQTEDK